MDIRFEAGLVYLAFVENKYSSLDGKYRRVPVHIEAIANDQICWCEGPKGDEHWEEARRFYKRKPVCVGRVRQPTFWRGAKYIFRGSDVKTNDVNVLKAEIEAVRERRKYWFEECKKAAQALLMEAEETIAPILQSAERVEADRKWIIRDDVLFPNDTQGKAREALPT